MIDSRDFLNARKLAETQVLLPPGPRIAFAGDRAQLDGVDFQGADLRDADFKDAVLTGCSLAEANVTKARFDGADLRGADLGNLQLSDASRFKGAIISKKQGRSEDCSKRAGRPWRN
jgi:uncharacterized protein YjbI with pentapeptide repeats